MKEHFAIFFSWNTVASCSYNSSVRWTPSSPLLKGNPSKTICLDLNRRTSRWFAWSVPIILAIRSTISQLMRVEPFALQKTSFSLMLLQSPFREEGAGSPRRPVMSLPPKNITTKSLSLIAFWYCVQFIAISPPLPYILKSGLINSAILMRCESPIIPIAKVLLILKLKRFSNSLCESFAE